MKTRNNIWGLTALITVMLFTFATESKAQVVKNSYFNIDWQFNIPTGNHFTDEASGWGMNFEGGCYVAPRVALGLFMAYQTNNQYIPRKTIVLSEKSTVTTDQQHSTFQLPFGVASRINFIKWGMFNPYFGLKLGAQYSEMTTYYNIFEKDDNSWGFTLSPELGTTIYPMPSQDLGIHFALYYSYATNKGEVFSYRQSGLNNIGFRLGLAF